MACALVQGKQLDCRDSVGGIKELYLTEFTNLTQSNITVTSGVITAFTLNSTKKFWTFQLEKENAEAIENETSSVENGTIFYEQLVNFTMNKLNSGDRNSIRQIAQNRVLIIVLDNNGVYWLFGRQNGMDKVGANTANTGKAMGDRSGFALAFRGLEPLSSEEVTASLIATLRVPA